MTNLILRYLHIMKFLRFKLKSKRKHKVLMSKIKICKDVWLDENIDDSIKVLRSNKLYSKKEYIKKYYSVNKNKNLLYIHEDEYHYHIQPKLNNKRYASIMGNKGLLDYHLSKIEGLDLRIIPTILIRNFDNVVYDNQFKQIHVNEIEMKINKGSYQRIIYKESLDTGGGRGVCFFEKDREEFINEKGIKLKDFILRKSNYIIQVAIKQHSIFNNFNSSSINTLRIITYRSVKDEEIHIIQSFIRYGVDGSKYDNFDKGGGIVNVNSNGMLEDRVLNNDGKINNFAYKGVMIPQFSNIINTAIMIARYSFFTRVLGFDFTVDENSQIKLLEINYGGINPEPSNILSGPLFGQYSKEVLNYCKNRSFPFILKGEIN